MHVKKYYLRMKQEVVEDFLPLANADITAGMFQLLYQRFCEEITLDRLTLSVRVRTAMLRSKIYSLWQLRTMSPGAIQRIPGAGKKVRDELYTVIKKETGVKLENLLEI